jgi:hypothetical protein
VAERDDEHGEDGAADDPPAPREPSQAIAPREPSQAIAPREPSQPPAPW